MADMTLQQVRDWHLAQKVAGPCAPPHIEMADAIDAHIAGMGEPVGTLRIRLDGWYVHGNQAAIRDLGRPTGEYPLYLAPPASGDWDKVRDEIADMRNTREIFGSDVDGWADKLTAALPENAK